MNHSLQNVFYLRIERIINSTKYHRSKNDFEIIKRAILSNYMKKPATTNCNRQHKKHLKLLSL